MKTLILLFAACCCVGCRPTETQTKVEPTDHYELVCVTNAELYRINKSSGEVVFISGTKMAKLEDLASELDEPSKYIRKFPLLAITNAEFGSVRFALKTRLIGDWLLYIFDASGERLEGHRRTGDSKAQFNISVCDAEGFTLKKIEVPLSDMARMPPTEGRVSFRANSREHCEMEIYKAVQSWTIGWQGFPSSSEHE